MVRGAKAEEEVMLWYVLETPCWPATWKVTRDGPRGQKDWGDNATFNFFRLPEKAEKEAKKRNLQWQKKKPSNGLKSLSLR